MMNKGKAPVHNKEGEKMTFGHIDLPVYIGRQKYLSLREHSLDDVQQCLVDNIWNMSTPNKPRVINALTYYFNKIIQRPLGKAFSCYAVARGESPGLYKTWTETKYAIGHDRNPLYKGFYEYEAASNWIGEHVLSSYTLSGEFLKGLSLERRRAEGNTEEINTERVPSPGPKIGDSTETSLLTDFAIHRLKKENESLKKKLEIMERESLYPIKSDSLDYKARLYLTANRAYYLSRFPPEIKEKILDITKEKFEDNFLVLQGLFSAILRGHNIPGLQVTYNHIYKPTEDVCYTPEDPLCRNIPLEYAACQCQLMTSIKTAVVDSEKFQPIELEGWPDGKITLSTLLDYGLLSHIYISRPYVDAFGGRRLYNILQQYLINRNYCYIRISSSIPEYIDDKFQEALHKIRIYPGYRSYEVDIPTIPWESKIPMQRQMAYHRAYIYGYSFLEDYNDCYLLSETKNQRIYVPIGAHIFEPPFYMEVSDETERLADEWSRIHESDTEDIREATRDSPVTPDRLSDIEDSQYRD